uniref:Envelope glycoprotein M n=1 Tax=Infectious laryngotracheitis virus TaxID=10386 RepID=A0A7M3URH8_ILTV|nr:envelope glycoprotein M [Gallid alphaherpesvirus 1]
MSGYYYSGQESRLERIAWRMWLIEVISFVILVLISLASAFSTLSPQAGFPCFFGNVAGGHLKPATPLINQPGLLRANEDGLFFISSPGMIFTVYATMAVWILLAIYVTLGAVRAKTCNHDRSYGASELTSAVISTPALMSIIITVWAWQLFVLLLSYRQLTLSAVTFCIIFVSGIVFLGTFASSGKTPDQYSVFNSQLKSACPEVHCVVSPFKAVVLNVYASIMGVWGLIMALSGALVMTVNFGVSVPASTLGAMIAFLIIGIIYLIVTELVLAKYVHVLIGPHFGLIIALGMLGTASLHYANTLDSGTHPNWKPAAAGILGVFALLVLVLAILRVVRAYRYHQYRQTDFIRKVTTVATEALDKTVKRKTRREKYKSRRDKHVYETVPYDDEL